MVEAIRQAHEARGEALQAERLARVACEDLEQVREQFRTLGAELVGPDLREAKVPVAQVKGVDPAIVLGALPVERDPELGR